MSRPLKSTRSQRVSQPLKSRRDVMVGGMGLATLMLSGCDRKEKDQQLLQAHSEFVSSAEPVLEALGVEAPSVEEVAVARRLIDAAPTSGNPIETARYFSGLTEKNEDNEKFNAEWVVRANPVIVEFFVATHTVPSGDTTHWCAAFVNWCLMRVKWERTGSAASGSFRCKGEAAVSPQTGDIVVFANKGTEAHCEGSGHVGFYVSATDSSVVVLGGNQRDSVKTSQYSRDGSTLILHSIRSVNSFKPKYPTDVRPA